MSFGMTRPVSYSKPVITFTFLSLFLDLENVSNVIKQSRVPGSCKDTY